VPVIDQFNWHFPGGPVSGTRCDVAIGHREVALPLGIAGVGFRQPLADGEVGLIGFERAYKLALRLLNLGDPVVAHREIALPARVAGAGFCQPNESGEAVPIGFQPAGKVAL
jgi:hypothetical protein